MLYLFPYLLCRKSRRTENSSQEFVQYRILISRQHCSYTMGLQKPHKNRFMYRLTPDLLGELSLSEILFTWGAVAHCSTSFLQHWAMTPNSRLLIPIRTPKGMERAQSSSQNAYQLPFSVCVSWLPSLLKFWLVGLENPGKGMQEEKICSIPPSESFSGRCSGHCAWLFSLIPLEKGNFIHVFYHFDIIADVGSSLRWYLAFLGSKRH